MVYSSSGIVYLVILKQKQVCVVCDFKVTFQLTCHVFQGLLVAVYRLNHQVLQSLTMLWHRSSQIITSTSVTLKFCCLWYCNCLLFSWVCRCVVVSVCLKWLLVRVVRGRCILEFLATVVAFVLPFLYNLETVLEHFTIQSLNRYS